MDEIVDRFRLDPYITVHVLGDHSKTLLMPLWGKKSPMPGVYIKKTEDMIVNIWDIPSSSSSSSLSSNRMSKMHSDSSDVVMLIIDLNYRKSLSIPSLEPKELISQAKKSQTHLRLAIIITDGQHDEIEKLCKQENLITLVVDNTIWGLPKTVKFLETNLNSLFQKRRENTLAEFRTTVQNL
jgi:hypothetical protein